MPNVDLSDEGSQTLELEAYHRRTWLQRLSGAVVGAALAAAGCSPDSPGPSAASRAQGPSFLRKSPSAMIRGPLATPLGVPTVSWLPPGYIHSWSIRDPADGFRHGDELVEGQFVMYHRDGARQDGAHFPLAIYFAPGAGGSLAGTGGGVPIVPVEVPVGSGFTAAGQYCDGMWRFPLKDEVGDRKVPVWASGEGHFLILALPGLQVGIFSLARNDVGLSSLLRVANGLQFA